MHVLHVAQPTSEGVAVVVCRLIEDQVSRGWIVDVACPSNGWLADRARYLGAQVSTWESRRSPFRGVLRESKALKDIVEQAKPDVVHLHSAKAGLDGRLVLRGRYPTAFQPHAWSFHAAGLARPAAIAWERWAARWSDVILAVSRDEMNEGLAAGIRARYEVVPNGVVLNDRQASSRREARGALQLERGPVVVCIGRLSHQKGQDRLLSIWPRVRRSLPTARLYLVGEGPLEAVLERDASAGVHLCGASNEVALWLAAADVVALPSRWEAGSSLVLLEAMGACRSVVATRVAGVGDALQPGMGAVVPQNASEQLEREIVRRLQDPELADSEGERARAWVEQHFDSSKLSRRTAALYAGLLP